MGHQRPAATGGGWANRSWEFPTYGGLRQFFSDLFVTVIAYIVWRIDAFFTLVWVQALVSWFAARMSILAPTLINDPFTLSYSLVIPFGLSLIQRAYWPRRKKRNADKQVTRRGSTPVEFFVWALVIAFNVASTFMGLALSVSAENIAAAEAAAAASGQAVSGVGIVTTGIAANGPWLNGGLLVLSIIFAAVPELLVELFGLRWLLLVRHALGGLWWNVRGLIGWEE